MRRVFLRSLSSCLLALSVLGLGATSASAEDNTATTLPFAAVKDMLVDGERGVVLVSGQAPGHDGVAVMDLGGHIEVIVPVAAPGPMALVGDEVVVAQVDLPTMAVIDLTAEPPAVTRTLDLTPFKAVTDLAQVGGRLWATCSRTDGTAAMVSIDPLTGRATTELPPHGMLADHADRAGDPVTFASNVPGEGLTVYHPEATGLEEVKTVPPPSEMETPGTDMDVMPGGGAVVLAGASEKGVLELSTVDGSLRQIYRSDIRTAAVDVRDDGRIAAVSTDIYGTARAWVYEPGSADPVWRYDFVRGGEWAPPAAIAWAPSGDVVFVVLGDRTQIASSAFYVIHTTGGVPDERPTPTGQVVPPSPVPAGTQIPISAGQIGGVIIDDATGRVFVSEGLDGDEVIVVGLDGVLEGTIPVPTPTRMLLAGGRLLVVSPSTRSIREFDTTTLGPAGTIELGPIGTPVDVASDGGVLWATVSTDVYPVLVELDENGNVRRRLAFEDSPGEMHFLQGAGQQDRIVLTYDLGIQVFDTSGAKIRRIAVFPLGGYGGNCRGLDVQIWRVDAGVLPGCPPSDHRFTSVFGRTTHAAGGRILGTSYSGADGGRVAVAVAGFDSPDVFVFEGVQERPSWSVALASLDAVSQDTSVFTQGIAIDADGTAVAVVVADPTNGARVLVLRPGTSTAYPSPSVLPTAGGSDGSFPWWIVIASILIAAVSVGVWSFFARRGSGGPNDRPPGDVSIPSRPDAVRR